MGSTTATTTATARTTTTTTTTIINTNEKILNVSGLFTDWLIFYTYEWTEVLW